MIKACLENNTFKEIVTHLEKELKLNGLEAPDKLQMSTVRHYATNLKADRPKPTCHDFKKTWTLQKSVSAAQQTEKTG